MNIFVDAALAGDDLARLQEIAAADHLVFGEASDSTPMPADFAACEVAFGNVPVAWLTASDKLRWVQLESVGFGEYGALDWNALGTRLKLTNLAGFFAEPVAESILAGILALYRGIDRVVELRQRGEWQGDALRPRLRTLHGAKVVLFGHGSINQRLAELLAPFNCNIQSFARDWRPAALDVALADADILVSVVPHTSATVGVFDEWRLALLPATSLFANFGRGSVSDDDALADALMAGRLAGAVIDVTRDEPLAQGHRFWNCPNLILTQHSGGGTGDERLRKFEVFAANLARYRAGCQLEGVVDFHRGY